MERACLVVLLSVSSAIAQLDSNPIVRHLKLRLSFANGVCDPTARVKLMATNGPMMERNPDDQCEINFVNVPSGRYQVEISGQNFSETEEIITTTDGTTDFELRLKDAAVTPPSGPAVSAAALSIPAKAVKEFDKSNQLITRQEFPKAIESLNRAIAIYPSYAAAYNNLGAVYHRLGNRGKEREALLKAVSLDGHLAAAYLNLGRMNIADNDFEAAETMLNKASANNPTDPTTLTLLCYSQYREQHPDDAIASARRAHGLAGQHSSVHLIAAKAFEQKRDAPGAIEELELFLKEEPMGERADQAQKDLKILRSIH